MARKTVFLSTGHNLERKLTLTLDRGAAANGTTEFEECEKVASAVTRYHANAVANGENPNFEIVRVPVGLSIAGRCKWINERCKDGDAVVELHMNAAVPNATGVETFYFAGSGVAKEIARAFQMEYTRLTGLVGRGVKGDTETRHGRLGIIRDTKPLAILVECGFITNANDLQAFRVKGANAAYAGIRKAFG